MYPTPNLASTSGMPVRRSAWPMLAKRNPSSATHTAAAESPPARPNQHPPSATGSTPSITTVEPSVGESRRKTRAYPASAAHTRAARSSGRGASLAGAGAGGEDDIVPCGREGAA
jgi:hypothetical protein